jgi:hypothetical protein
MRRKNIFEFEDFDWFPDYLREGMTVFLNGMHRFLKTHLMYSPVLVKTLEKCQTDKIIDCCSGGGGPVEFVQQESERLLGKPVYITMTDVYPNKAAIERFSSEEFPRISYLSKPVNASAVDSSLKGVRTFFTSFHHMPKPIAKEILKDAFDKRQGICLFEITANTFPAILSTVFLVPMAFVGILVSRPFSWRRLFFTFVIPVLPLFIFWDGFASQFRSYSVKEYEEMTLELRDPGYEWEIGHLSSWIMPFKMAYLVGYPKH